MSERKDHPTSSSRSNAKEKETSHANREGQKWDSFQLFSCPSKVPSFPSTAPSISISDPLAWHLLLLQWVKCGEDGEGKGREEGGDAHSSAIKDLLLALPSSSSLPVWCSRGRAGREGSIYGGEREGEHRPLHIILQSFLAFRISLFSSRQRRYFYPHGVRMVGQDFLKGELNWLN